MSCCGAKIDQSDVPTEKPNGTAMAGKYRGKSTQRRYQNLTRGRGMEKERNGRKAPVRKGMVRLRGSGRTWKVAEAEHGYTRRDRWQWLSGQPVRALLHSRRPRMNCNQSGPSTYQHKANSKAPRSAPSSWTVSQKKRYGEWSQPSLCTNAFQIDSLRYPRNLKQSYRLGMIHTAQCPTYHKR